MATRRSIGFAVSRPNYGQNDFVNLLALRNSKVDRRLRNMEVCHLNAGVSGWQSTVDHHLRIRYHEFS